MAYVIHDWEWDGSAPWNKITPVDPHPGFGTASHQIAYDMGRDEIVMFAATADTTPRPPNTILGQTPPATMVRNSSMVWSEPAIAQPSFSNIYAQIAYDEANDEIVLVAYNAAAGDTWTRGASGLWVHQTPAHAAIADPNFTNVQMCYDQVRNKVVIVQSKTFFLDPFIVKEWDGTDWTAVAGFDAGGSSGPVSIAWDSTHSKIVFFGYASGTTWTRSGTTWTQQFPANSPGGSVALMCDSPPNGGVICNSSGDGTWIWDDTDWTQVQAFQTEPDEPVSPYAYMAWDPDRGRVFAPGFFESEDPTGSISHLFGLSE